MRTLTLVRGAVKSALTRMIFSVEPQVAAELPKS